VRTIKKPRVAKAKLSFALDEEEEDGGEESSENGQKGAALPPREAPSPIHSRQAECSHG
jgi:hypothetical protein